MLDTVHTTIDTAMEDDAARGVFRVGRSVFTNPALFELEMKHIFEGNRLYMASTRIEAARLDSGDVAGGNLG